MENIVTIKDFIISMIGEIPPQYEIFVILLTITIFIAIIMLVIFIIKWAFHLLGAY